MPLRISVGDEDVAGLEVLSSSAPQKPMLQTAADLHRRKRRPAKARSATRAVGNGDDVAAVPFARAGPVDGEGTLRTSSQRATQWSTRGDRRR